MAKKTAADRAHDLIEQIAEEARGQVIEQIEAFLRESGYHDAAHDVHENYAWNSEENDMDQSDIYRYSQRGEIDKEIEAMRNRIIEERRQEIGRQAAFNEAIEVTTGWYSDQYMRIENEVTARWGIHA